jgi:hypothetical protein
VRFAGLGALVLVPGLVGLLSMTFAASTILHSHSLAFLAGLVWASIVVAADRYLVSTQYKSKFSGAGSRLPAILVRYVVAIFIGIAVSHPFVMMLFDPSITQTIAENQRRAVAEVRSADALEKATVSGSPDQPELTRTSGTLGCLRILQTAEQSGRAVDLPCGSGSGLKECSRRCDVIREQIIEVEADVARLRGRVDLQDEDRARALSAINERTEAKIREVRAMWGTDYLARVRALQQLARSEPHVRRVEVFMILLFVLIDILPITMKLTTPTGEYEEIRDSRLHEVREREGVARALASGDVVRRAAEVRARHRAKLDEAESLASTVVDMMGKYERNLDDLREGKRRIGVTADLADNKARITVSRNLAELWDSSADAWSATIGGLVPTNGRHSTDQGRNGSH